MTDPRPYSQLHDRVGAPPQVADNPLDIRLWQLAAAKGAIKLEGLGMKHSRIRGGVRALWAKHFQMPPRSSHEAVIARLDQEINSLKEKRDERTRQQSLGL